MKAYTDLEQSKKLAKILPIESADMHWCLSYFSPKDDIEKYEEFPVFGYSKEFRPCWSIVALMDILRKSFEVCVIGYEKAWKCHVTNRETLVTDWLLADNPIDCCYGMILKLHELKLL